MTASPGLETSAAVRPVVLALAPPAPGVSQGATTPCLEMLGGSRLIERLLGTLAGAGLSSPLVLTLPRFVPALQQVLGERAKVLGAEGGRRGALTAALAETDEELLLLHDAERALTPASVVSEVLAALEDEVEAVLPVIALTDSVKAVRPRGLLNIDRSTLAGLQSPRLMRRELLERCLAQPGRTGIQEAAALDATARGTAGENLPERFDELLAALDVGARVRTIHGSHAGFAVVDRLSLWQAQISLGLARDTSHRYGLARRA